MDKNTENNNTGLSQKNIWNTLDFYLKDKLFFLNLYKKVHKLSAAIFLVSNNIEDNEILKSNIKDLCVGMLSVIVSLKDASSHLEVQRILSSIEAYSLKMISLLDIASISGSVSIMNTDIIKNEFDYVLREVNSFRMSSNSVESKAVGSILSESKVQDDYNGQNNVSEVAVKSFSIKDNNIQKDIQSDGKRQNRKSTRKSLIYEYILKHKNSNIKDIVPNIKGCSEKTVQREIIDLIKEGRVSKVGERRWSRYSVI